MLPLLIFAAVPARAQVVEVPRVPVAPAFAAAGALAPALMSAPFAAPSLPSFAPSPAPAAAPRPGVPRHDGTPLGVLADPKAELDGAKLGLREWRWLSFAVETEDPKGAGEVLIDGEPAERSKLEHKHSVRTVVRDGKTLYRHEYGFLALLATPEASYAVSMPSVGANFSIAVAHEDRSTPEERLKLAGETMRAAFSSKTPEPEYGEGVSARARAFLTPHLSIVGRRQADYRRYLNEDPALDENERARLLGDLDRLEEFQADLVSGKVRYRGLAPVVAQLMAREHAPTEEYLRYLRDDPAVGRVGGELHSAQIVQYRDIMKTTYEVYAKLDETKPPSLVARAVGRVAGWWFRFKAWRALRRRR